MSAERKTTLFLKHLPSSLSEEDKIGLIKHFGATLVKCMGNNGTMKNCAFASFPDHEVANDALKRLHQLEVLNCTISAEFSRQQQYHQLVTDIFPESKKDVKSREDERSSEHISVAEDDSDDNAVSRRINSLCSCWGFNYPPNPNLNYGYPPPNPVILANVANALAAVPKFYVQVLHLMNKMNLPAPFGVPTMPPPLADPDLQENSLNVPPLPLEEPYVPEPPNEPVSSEESEIESDHNESDQLQAHIQPVLKKRASNLIAPTTKRMKISHLTSQTEKPSIVRNIIAREEAFEYVEGGSNKKIEVKMPPILAEGINLNELRESGMLQSQKEYDPFTELIMETPTVVGFGQIKPKSDSKHNIKENASVEEEWDDGEFITSEKLKTGRLSQEELSELSVFRNYKRGEKSRRLYIKNLAKHVTEKDIHHIFGRYVSWEDDVEKLMFDIRLMKEGRMKGQAFVTLPNEEVACEALEDTNGYILLDKPIVVQFARSAKQKEKNEK